MIPTPYRYAALLALAGAMTAAPAFALVGPAWTMVGVGDAWVREAPPTATAMAGYMTLSNPSKEALTLVGATSPQFGEVQMHEIVQENGMSKMQQVKALKLPAMGTLSFAPGSTHLMLMAPKKPLKAGEPVEIVLQWSPAGKTTVKTAVRPRAAQPSAAPAHDHSGHEHHH
jgi:copper(I)-binding protein